MSGSHSGTRSEEVSCHAANRNSAQTTKSESYHITKHDKLSQRWLRAHKPAAGKQALPASHQSASEVAVPMFSSSVSPATSPPSRPAAWGTLSAWCNTICSIGMQPAMYRYVAAKLEALCADVEAQVSQVSTLVRKRPAAAAVSAGSASESTGSAELHPTVAVDVMEMPPHRKRKQGRVSEKRQQSAVERASKGMRVPASQLSHARWTIPPHVPAYRLKYKNRTFQHPAQSLCNQSTFASAHHFPDPSCIHFAQMLVTLPYLVKSNADVVCTSSEIRGDNYTAPAAHAGCLRDAMWWK